MHSVSNGINDFQYKINFSFNAIPFTCSSSYTCEKYVIVISCMHKLSTEVNCCESQQKIGIYKIVLINYNI